MVFSRYVLFALVIVVTLMGIIRPSPLNFVPYICVPDVVRVQAVS